MIQEGNKKEVEDAIAALKNMTKKQVFPWIFERLKANEIIFINQSRKKMNSIHKY